MLGLLASAIGGVACGQSEDTPPTARILPDQDNSVLDSARADIAKGLPWRATLRLAPIVADTARTTPEAVMVAAEAANGWRGWAHIERILADHTWVDTLFAGRARSLLARAALERREDTTAVEHARAAVRTSAGAVDRPERLIVLARAYHRTEQFDNAVRAYRDAERELPRIAQWLRLRAAAVTADSATRYALYDGLTRPAPRSQISVTEAEARLWTGDTLGAIRIRRAGGVVDAALELELAIARSSAESLAVRRELASIVTAQRPRRALARAIALLDDGFAPLSPDEELAVGRGANIIGMTRRAATGFRRAFAAGKGSMRDRFSFGNILARLGRHREAAVQFRRVTRPKSLAASAAYLGARSLLRGGLGGSRDALRQILKVYPGELASVRARILLSDLAIDEGRDTAARRTYQAAATSHPSSPYAPLARFQAAIIALVENEARAAAGGFDSLVRKHPASSESLAGLYWAGRAWEAAGDSSAAVTRWRRVIRRETWSYYGLLSARRLGEVQPLPPLPDSVRTYPGIDSAVSRVDLLRRLGLSREARLEENAIVEAARDSADMTLAVAEGLSSIGNVSRAIRLAWRAVDLGAKMDGRTLRLLYPVLQRDGILALAREHGVEPALIAGLIRQESAFDPSATSRAGARGLMQIMPDVGRRVARAEGFPFWDPVLLYQPDVSLQLGVTHLRDLLRRSSDLPHVLAAYNAGTSRLDRWLMRPGADDLEVFIERIPFRETRGYVRAVLRNRDVYRLLYSWEARTPTD
ncbi:MAG: transglycosylase SLT domain-containing protein [Gemmatimonadales bacterium]|nr:transglycosylase SLT domain-containing protein [Gemmatimonadales bacterium]